MRRLVISPAGIAARSFLFGIILSGCGAAPALATDRIAWLRDLGLGQGLPLVVLPPGAGTVIGIDEQRKTDSFVQTVTLAGDRETIGENKIVVTVTRNGLAPRIEEDTVATEVQRQLPDLPLILGPTGTRNTFGLFGAVVGGKGGLQCLYAWQRVNLADKWITDESATPFEERHAMTMRYRLCRTTATTAELISFVEGGQSGLFNTRAMPRPSAGYDALAAAASLSSTPTAVDRHPIDAEPGAMPNDGSPHLRTVRSTQTFRTRVLRPDRGGADGKRPPQTIAPDVPMP